MKKTDRLKKSKGKEGKLVMESKKFNLPIPKFFLEPMKVGDFLIFSFEKEKFLTKIVKMAKGEIVVVKIQKRQPNSGINWFCLDKRQIRDQIFFPEESNFWFGPV